MIFRLFFRSAEEKYVQLIEDSAAAQARHESGASISPRTVRGQGLCHELDS